MLPNRSRNPNRPFSILGGQRGGLNHRLGRLSTSPDGESRGLRWLRRVVVAVVLGRCALVLLGWPETSLVADDAYYYFTIARHLALGDGPTFDGIAPTNGFQPLWQLLLVPLFRLPLLWWPVRAVGLLEIGLDLLSAWILRRWAREFLGPARADLAAALWLVLPAPFLLGLRGMEAALATPLLLGCFWQASQPVPRPAWQLGLWLGLAALARIDHGLSAGLSLGLLLLLARGQSLRARMGRLAVVGLTSAALVAPWLLWCRLQFGSFLPVSGQVKLYTDRIVSALPHDFSSPRAAADSLLHAVAAPVLTCVRWLCGEEFAPSHWSGAATALTLAAGGALLYWGVRAWWRRGGARTVILCAGFVVVHELAFGVIWRSYSVWYAHPLLALACLALAAVPISPSRRRVRLAIASFAALQIALAVAYVLRVEHGARGAERAWRERFDRVLAVAPAGGRIGAWDAGAAGYVALLYPQIRIVNLDGLVNNVAFAAVREGRYGEYLLSELDYLIQPPERARMYLQGEALTRFLEEFKRRHRPALDN